MKDFGTFRRHFWAAPLEAAMLAGVYATVQAGDYFHTLTSVFTFLISFIPLVFEKIFRVRLAAIFQVGYVGFVFLSMFCGEVLRFYANIRGWDAAMYTFSGVAGAFGVILWLRLLIRRKKIHLPLLLQHVFAFSFSMAIAVAWELVEFSSDQLFGTSSQDRSLYDTMTDLLYQTIGAAILAGAYFRFVNGARIIGMEWLLNRFEKLNPS